MPAIEGVLTDEATWQENFSSSEVINGYLSGCNRSIVLFISLPRLIFSHIRPYSLFCEALDEKTATRLDGLKAWCVVVTLIHTRSKYIFNMQREVSIDKALQ